MTKSNFHLFRRTVLLAGMIAISVAGCSHDTPSPFENCGNGILDAGEECDDGPGLARSSDTDGCLTTCRLARCGDGFVQSGVEECDTNNLDICNRSTCTCGSLGLAEGAVSGAGTSLRCSASCAYDVSGCGAPLSTMTPTQPPTSTPTPTTSPTPRQGTCGNGRIEADETCDDGNTSDNDECPSDCRVRSCTLSGTRLRAAVTFAVSGSNGLPRSATVLVSYPDGVVGLPDGDERGRLVRNNQYTLAFEADFDHALRARVGRNQGIPSADIFLIDFDRCSGADLPSPDELSCQVLACDDVPDCHCSVELR